MADHHIRRIGHHMWARADHLHSLSTHHLSCAIGSVMRIKNQDTVKKDIGDLSHRNAH